MTIESLVGRIIRLPGNLERGRSIYVSAPNMDRFSDQLIGVDAKQGILITPYLISKEGTLYELHYYEFDIEVRGGKSYFVGYNENNTLPKEIIEKLIPQAIVAIGDTEFHNKVVKEYLSKMATMRFDEDKRHYPQMQSAQLFYQILIDQLCCSLCCEDGVQRIETIRRNIGKFTKLLYPFTVKSIAPIWSFVLYITCHPSERITVEEACEEMKEWRWLISLLTYILPSVWIIVPVHRLFSAKDFLHNSCNMC